MMCKTIKARIRSMLKMLCSRIYHLFTNHPHDAGETYLQHFWFTFKMGLRFLKIFFAIMIHGVFPFLCTRTASNEVKKIYAVMQKRASAPLCESSLDTRKRVAIIGGGFSGAMTLVQLIKQASGNGSHHVIDVFEPRQVLGQGVAYGTKDTTHLLNVRAGNMGAFAEDVGHFYAWLCSEQGQQACEAIWPDVRVVEHHDFVPRAVYALYVDVLVQDALRMAREKGIQVQHHRAYVTDIKIEKTSAAAQMRIVYGDGGVRQTNTLAADAVVLATGNLPPRRHKFISEALADSPFYVHDIWKSIAEPAWIQRVTAFTAQDSIVIIGTGLTMVDTVLALQSIGYKGKVVAVSRSGCLPHMHDAVGATAYPAWAWCTQPESAPKTALGLLVGLRKEVRDAAALGYDWRRVIDSIRPVTQQLWAQLPTSEKKKFFARLFTLWNVHRHRMSPEIANKIHVLQENGMLEVVAGKFKEISPSADNENINVKYIYSHNKNVLANIHSKMLVNCTGPDYSLSTSSDALLHTLLHQKLIQEHALGIGLAMTTDNTARGDASQFVYPLGTLRVGEQLECTAVPELRQQAYEVACRIMQQSV